ncbi:hypothetical protein ACIO3S_24395 [Nocardioides sp. NPDC087217]|uniref:hypothetical protein n=1 Tax=Nocardioides sp. NPDC087217 TaxID=3364335 RepID=UPI0037FA8714
MAGTTDDRLRPAEIPVPGDAEEAAGLLMRLHRFETVELVKTLDLLDQVSADLTIAYREAEAIRAALAVAGPELRRDGMHVLAQRLVGGRKWRAVE